MEGAKEDPKIPHSVSQNEEELSGEMEKKILKETESEKDLLEEL